MTEEKPINGQLMDIGTLAAKNIAITLGLPESSVDSIKQAIRDEITAMSSHFTMAFADMQFNFEKEVREVKRTFSYVKANKWAVGAVAFALLVVGFLAGVLV